MLFPADRTSARVSLGVHKQREGGTHRSEGSMTRAGLAGASGWGEAELRSDDEDEDDDEEGEDESLSLPSRDSAGDADDDDDDTERAGEAGAGWACLALLLPFEGFAAVELLAMGPV